MPLNLPDKLPAIELLKEENIFVIDTSRATQQDIRPLRIVILNLMPLKITTETDLVRLLSNTPLQVEISFMKIKSHTSKNTPIEHMKTFYTDFDQMRHEKYDGMIIENTSVEVNGVKREFDGMWSSSLTDSTSKGKPDIEAVDLTTRLHDLNDTLECTTKPVIFDGDTGGKIEHFVFTVRTLERLGISAIIIEDKVGLKKNSLFGTDAVQVQDSIEGFCAKIKAGKRAQVTDDFMIIARIESFIAGKGLDDAMERALAYIEAGADGIMIHSKHKSGADIKEFCAALRKVNKSIPIVVVPTTYNHITDDELAGWGVNIVIYANHMLRSAYPAMLNTAKSILANGRSYEANELCMPVKEILELIPGTK